MAWRDFPAGKDVNYIGFYWTRPVTWAKHTDLPRDVDEAAEQSLTIRYQRDLVRSWVKARGVAKPIHEEAFMEVAPDRGTDVIVPVLGGLLRRCRREPAQLVVVKFWDPENWQGHWGWRSHAPLRSILEDPDNVELCNLIDPVPIELVPGQPAFDPIGHFRKWEEVQRAFAEQKRDREVTAERAILELMDAHDGEVSRKQLADELNARKILTPTGKTWTAENLRKFMKAMVDP